MFCYLINIKKFEFFLNKKPVDDNPIHFWIVTVQDWYRTSPAFDEKVWILWNF